MTFSPFGSETGSTGSITTQLGYDGQYTSPDSGLIYMQARVYDPATAQFLTVDPLAATTRAPYTYAADNPLRYRDRSGLGWEENLEGPGIPTPWNEWEHAGEELLRPGVEAIEHSAENIWHAINENEEVTDEGESALREDREREASECGKELAREGNEILKRGHKGEKGKAWNEWWKELGRSERKLYDKWGGKRPSKGQ